MLVQLPCQHHCMIICGGKWVSVILCGMHPFIGGARVCTRYARGTQLYLRYKLATDCWRNVQVFCTDLIAEYLCAYQLVSVKTTLSTSSHPWHRNSDEQRLLALIYL